MVLFFLLTDNMLSECWKCHFRDPNFKIFPGVACPPAFGTRIGLHYHLHPPNKIDLYGPAFSGDISRGACTLKANYNVVKRT